MTKSLDRSDRDPVVPESTAPVDVQSVRRMGFISKCIVTLAVLVQLGNFACSDPKPTNDEICLGDSDASKRKDEIKDGLKELRKWIKEHKKRPDYVPLENRALSHDEELSERMGNMTFQHAERTVFPFCFPCTRSNENDRGRGRRR